MRLSKKLLSLIITILVLAVLLVAASLSGLFSYQNGSTRKQNQENSTTLSKSNSVQKSVKYRHITRTINGLKQEINLLEINLKDPSVKIVPVLSHDLVYGFENLSSIVKRTNAYAAVNAGFFSANGIPAGLVVIDGNIISASSSFYPVFSCSRGKAALKEIKIEAWIEAGDKRIRIDTINIPGSTGNITLFTKYFGTANRADTKNRSITIRNGTVTCNSIYPGKTAIPEDGFLVTDHGNNPDLAKIKIGDTVRIVYSPDPAQLENAYECGSWIVKKSKVVIGEKDPWIGVTTNNDPRTAIGVKDKNTVVLLTVDGRQPGYSSGLTGKELGELMLEFGVTDAAMLDGGASTEMIVKGEIVNRPSFKGEERPLGGAITVIIK